MDDDGVDLSCPTAADSEAAAAAAAATAAAAACCWAAVASCTLMRVVVGTRTVLVDQTLGCEVISHGGLGRLVVVDVWAAVFGFGCDKTFGCYSVSADVETKKINAK